MRVRIKEGCKMYHFEGKYNSMIIIIMNTISLFDIKRRKKSGGMVSQPTADSLSLWN